MSRLTRDGTTEPVSRDQILRRERRQGIIHFLPCSVDHGQDWQPYSVDPYPCYVCVHGHTPYSKSMDQPDKIANPARDQLNRDE